LVNMSSLFLQASTGRSMRSLVPSSNVASI